MPVMKHTKRAQKSTVVAKEIEAPQLAAAFILGSSNGSGSV
jgi:hypothetical protein